MSSNRRAFASIDSLRMTPPGRPVLFVNTRPRGGKAERVGWPSSPGNAASTCAPPHPEQDLATLVEEAVAEGADTLGVAGGDGSLAIVALALAHELPSCVHFALDLGVDRRDLLVGSLDAFTDGVERRTDLAEVNGRLFLNNVSLAIYGDAVRPPAYGDAKARTLLDSGSSSSTKRAQVSLRATHFEVTGPTPVDAGVDGEAVDLTPPLRFVIRHNALRVRVPSSRA